MMQRDEHSGPDPQRPRITLTICHRDSPGVLKLTFPGGRTIRVSLPKRLVWVLRVMNAALVEDDGLEDFCGVRTNEQIRRAYAKMDPRVVPPEPLTMATYRALIHRLIREATPAGLQAPRIFATVRCGGVRLVGPIEIIDHSARREASSR